MFHKIRSDDSGLDNVAYLDIAKFTFAIDNFK
jgi:hypothetical protein